MKTRTFESGATRDTNDGKLVYDQFLSPHVLQSYARYMDRKRHMPDGSIRRGDNWQRGMPMDSLHESLLRHVMDLWLMGCSNTTDPVKLEDTLNAILFNTMAFQFELLARTDPDIQRPQDQGDS